MSREIGKPSSMRCIAACVAALVVAPLAAPAFSSGPDGKAWCADVIRINTKYGTMKNKHYISATQWTAAQRSAIVNAALAGKAQFLADTPTVLKVAVTHELAFYAHWRANNYSVTTALTPMTLTDVKQLAAYQRTHCGISGI